MAPTPPRTRTVRTAVVVRTEALAPDMVRVVFTGEDLRTLPELPYTDHYIKVLFAPAGAPYSWPYDVDQVKETYPVEHWPATRTYTLRSYDRARNEMAVDFLIHGDEGLAGPWAARAKPGDSLGFFGPGGSYAPNPDADAHLLVGDEAAIPAIAAALERMPSDATAHVFLEVASPEHHQALPMTANTIVTWVHRSDLGLPYGKALADTVVHAGLPTGQVHAFVHGNAEMVRMLRRHLVAALGSSYSQASVSGYWRPGHTEDRWQATKREFNAAMEADAAAVA
jgi:NADPH-dependent ferric siderophore reductase